MLSPLFILVPIGIAIFGGAAIIPIPFGSDRGRNIYAETVAILTSICVWIALLACSREPVVIYSFIEGFSMSFGIDGPAMLFAGMISVMWPFVLLYAFEYMEHADNKGVFFAFYVMTYGITLGVACAHNLVTMYVFFEMLTLVTIPLVGFYENHESLFAARRYAAYCIGGASLGFFAVVMATLDGGGEFIYGGTLSNVFSEELMRVVFLFGFFGFGTKAAVFPLHSWLPQAGVAPTPVTALLHAVAVVNSGVYAVMRLTWYSYGPDFLLGSEIQEFCVLTASFTLVFAAAAALKERHFKRRLAYSTVSNLSYMLFGIMLLTPEGLLAGLAHMLFHGVIKMSLFLCAGSFMHMTGNEYIYEVNGVGRRMPLTFTFYTLGALSLTGIPLFAGFISKWRLLLSGAASGTAVGVIGDMCLIVAAFLCAVYTISISIRAFFPVQGTDRYPGGIREAGWRMLVPIGSFAFLNILFGVWPGPVMGFIARIAEGLL